MQDHLEQLHAKALGLRSTALSKVGMTPEDLAKLNMLPLVTGIAGCFVIIIMHLSCSRDSSHGINTHRISSHVSPTRPLLSRPRGAATRCRLSS